MVVCDESNGTAALLVEIKQAVKPLSSSYMLAQSPGFESHCERYRMFCFVSVCYKLSLLLMFWQQNMLEACLMLQTTHRLSEKTCYIGDAALPFLQPASRHLCALLHVALHAAAFALFRSGKSCMRLFGFRLVSCVMQAHITSGGLNREGG